MKYNREWQINLANLFKARFPYIFIPTWEETRAVDFVESVASDTELIKYPRKVILWSQTKGLFEKGGKGFLGTRDPIKAFDHIEKTEEDAIYIFKDLHVFFECQPKSAANELIRRMRDIVQALRESESRRNIVLLSPELCIPSDLQKEITVFDFPLPDSSEIAELLERIIKENNLKEDGLAPQDKEKLVKAALGLTLQEAENAFARAIVQNKGISNESIPIIFDEKNQLIKKSGILEFVKEDLNMSDIGGLENLKNWLYKRNNSWLDSARKYNIPAPKGVLITGVPGCGKSLTAKAMSQIWQLPLLKLDMGKIFSGLVGSSEENMRRAIKTAEAVAPSILWIDEIEKGISTGAFNGDSGTSTRILGNFLTWMQEKKAPVFVVATSNNISALPPELLRKGRFDEIFFVDLPTYSEREKIFEVHLRRLVASSEVAGEVKVESELISRLAEMTEGFVGAEIEQVIITALYEAFFGQRDLLEEDLIKAVKDTVPLSVTQKEQIRALRVWASERAVSAALKSDLEGYTASTEGKWCRGGRLLDF